MRTTPLLLTGLLLAACTSDGDSPVDQARAIDDYLRALPHLPVAPETMMPGARSPAAVDGDYQCTTRSVLETRQLDRVVAYAANSESLYPGALIAGDSVVTGLFTQVVLPRAPATISVSLENLGGHKSAAVAEPSLSTYREALSDILDAEITGSTLANIYSEIEQVHSQQQLGLALGLEAGWALGTADVSTSFDWSSHDVKSRYLVRYTQSYYTVDLDAPAAPSALFAPGVTLDAIAAAFDSLRPPVYVSSVTYGRMVVFTFESSYSSEELGAALDFAYSGGVDVSGDVSVTYKDIISQSKITAFILGGDGGAAAQTIDSYDALIAFIRDGGNYTRESPGAPIAYKLTYLQDNAPARLSYTSTYEVKECARISQRILATLKSIAVDDAGGDAGGDLELYGQIWAEGATTGMLFDRDSANRVTIPEGGSFGGSTPVGEAVIGVTPRGGAAIRLHARLYDEDPVNPDDLIGDELVLAPFETGWRREATVTLTGRNTRVRAVFALQPI